MVENKDKIKELKGKERGWKGLAFVFLITLFILGGIAIHRDIKNDKLETQLSECQENKTIQEEVIPYVECHYNLFGKDLYVRMKTRVYEIKGYPENCEVLE